MASRRLLYVTAEDHYLYRAAGNGLELEGTFSGDDLGITAFREHLLARPGGLFSVVADLAGEDFHEEQVPLLRGGDREAIVQRRLAQRYRDTRLATALSLGEAPNAERRNERLLLASFTNTQQLAPWLDALEEADARLAGVYSVPLLAPALAARLGTKSGRVLVVTATRAGLRQCYVDNGKLRFARLERTIDMVPQALAMFVRSETHRLAQYLVTLRALPREGAPVQVLVVAPPGQKEVFEHALSSDARLVFHTIDYAQALQAAKLRKVPEATRAEALFLHLAAVQPPREQFASRQDRRRYLIWQLQRGIVAAGIAGFVACALYGGSKWLEVLDLGDRAAQQQREARTAAEQYERITAAFPVTQTSSENLKVAVVEFRRIADRSASPERALVHLSQVLARFPQMEIDTINWSVGRPGDRMTQRAAAPAAAPAAKPDAAGDLAVAVEVTGRVNATQRNDYRGITAQVETFATALASSGYQLVERKLPFDITSEGTLTGDIGATDTGEAPRFTIVFARALP
ncbi:MAG TPA: hypothetical protein VM140_00205 [Burkholderiales bacterium]|nr:hypothetical protein [Burkholderiales bacterium]